MRFDRERFKGHFDQDNNIYNPTLPPKTALDITHAFFFFLTFGWVVVPVAVLDSIIIWPDSHKEPPGPKNTTHID
jgi:hypothetical protein